MLLGKHRLNHKENKGGDLIRVNQQNPHISMTCMKRMKKEELSDLIKNELREAWRPLRKETLIDILNYELNLDCDKDFFTCTGLQEG